MRAAARMSRIPISHWGEVGRLISELKAKGMDVIRLDVGDPELPPSAEIIEALTAAVRESGVHGYPGVRVIPPLRRALADYYMRRFGISLDPDREVLPLIGSKEGIAHAAWAFVDPGDLVIIPEPAYPTYRQGAELASGDVVVVPLSPERGYLPDLGAIPEATARRAKMLWLNYPHNPTGAVASLEFFTEAVAFARQYDLVLCHDAPYGDVYYDGYRPVSALQAPGAKDVVLEFNSLSKTYNMAGWRVAMAVGCPAAVAQLARVKSVTDSGIFVPIQRAAIAALNGDQSWLEPRNAVYQQRRDLIFATLQELGLSPLKPLAGLYVWAQVPAPYNDSRDFVRALLQQQGVALSPGAMYGQGGEGFVRFSVTAATPRVAEAMARLRAFCR